MNKHWIRITRLTVAAVVALIIPLSLVFSMSAYIGDFKHVSHVMTAEYVSINLKESYIDDALVRFGATSLDYNAVVENNGNTGIYVFIEFDTPLIGTDPMLVPTEADGWVLYDEGTATINNVSYKKYVFAYSDGNTMTEVASDGKTGDVFSGVSIASMTQSQYETISNKPFHVVARSVASSSSDGNIDTVWGQVPSGY